MASTTDNDNNNKHQEGAVIYCSTEDEYYKALEEAGSKLVVIDIFAEWYVLL
jgi:hypothetical protein